MVSGALEVIPVIYQELRVEKEASANQWDWDWTNETHPTRIPHTFRYDPGRNTNCI